MKHLFLISLFSATAVFSLKAQSKADTIQPQAIEKVSKSGLMFYLNLGTSFALGGAIPQTYLEYEIATNGQPGNGVITGNSINRTGASYSAGGCYGLGLEYSPASETPYFNVFDVGVQGYSFNANVYDDIYTYNTGPNSNLTTSAPVANTYIYSYGVVELGIYQFYRFMKKGNKRLSVGLGALATFAFSGTDPVNFESDESNSSAIGLFLSSRLRLKSKLTSLDLFLDCGSCNGFSNVLVSTGIQFAFTVTP